MRRSQWLTSRSILSNWLSNAESEARQKVSLSRSTETFSSSPLLSGFAVEIVGLACFGFTPIGLSETPKSKFLDVNQVRDHWLSKMSAHSNWRTRTMNEELEKVSLENQVLSFSANPLLFDGLISCAGLIPFGSGMVNVSRLIKSLGDEDLLDSLATEDLDPIVTESDGDEITIA